MLYYLASTFVDQFSPLNVLTYFTVRAGGAAMTAFLISLIIGPAMIRWLRAVKVGQYIREDHVADLHALHKGKAGTPTMGGALILVSSLVSLLLWGRLENRLLLLAIAVFATLGALGAADDYIKLRRKHNQGLSARAKLLGQIVVGLLMGVYLYMSPITPTVTYLSQRHVTDWPGFVHALQGAGQSTERTAQTRFLELLPENQQRLVRTLETDVDEIEINVRTRLLEGFRTVMEYDSLYEADLWQGLTLTPEAQALLAKGVGARSELEMHRLNRLLLESAFPGFIFESRSDLHTRVEIPGFKFVFVSLGVFYIFFVAVIIVCASNAVNFTDGLDGLAIGASLVSLMAFTAIAYVVSRVDWSQYLYLIHVPDAGELTVFGATLLGAGLGFLWFNCHPAEVFMGDTGSLALGGAIGTLAVATKQELLLILVGGLFVLEGGSVVIQVLSFKLRGKRVFRMAPLHHHFELLGWSESKVIVRFWIMAVVFALMSFATLKLR